MKMKIKPDYYNRNEKKAYEKKWDVMQEIWPMYRDRQPNSVVVEAKYVEIEGRSPRLVATQFDALCEEGAFKKWRRLKDGYECSGINHNKLPKMFEKMRAEYNEYADAEDRKKLQVPFFDVNTGDFLFDITKPPIPFKEKSAHFRIIKQLWEKRPGAVNHQECQVPKSSFPIYVLRIRKKCEKYGYKIPIKPAGAGMYRLDSPANL